LKPIGQQKQAANSKQQPSYSTNDSNVSGLSFFGVLFRLEEEEKSI
jgi:hypothetical protein